MASASGMLIRKKLFQHASNNPPIDGCPVRNRCSMHTVPSLHCIGGKTSEMNVGSILYRLGV